VVEEEIEEEVRRRSRSADAAAAATRLRAICISRPGLDTMFNSIQI